MDPILEALIVLHDLDIRSKELQDPTYKKLGFESKSKNPLDILEEERRKYIAKIPENVLRRYKKLKNKYGRAVAPVIKDVCLNCFSHLPIAFVSQPEKNEKLQTCPNCGIFVYWA